ncbi:MAG: hypothetical protein KDA43_14475, partial [Hyphomonas sp.]|nr:hypothetical protein [Hyphomonas sp.]
RQMATMGAGIAILPNLYAVVEAQRDPTQVVRPIRHELARRSISLIWRKGSPVMPAIEAFGEVFREVAAELIGASPSAPQRRKARN